jgi:hypothetical protein
MHAGMPERRVDLVTRSTEQLNFGGMRQIDGIAFIRIDVDFQFRTGRQPNEQVFEHRRTRAANAQIHAIAVLHAKVGRIRRPHMNVALVTNNTCGQFDNTRRPHEPAAG